MRFKNTNSKWLALSTLLTCLVLVYTNSHFFGRLVRLGNPPDSPQRIGNDSEVLRIRQASRPRPGATLFTEERKRSSSSFQERWLALQSGDELSEDEYKSREQLALECAQCLLFSKELFDLEIFIEQNDIVVSKGGGHLSDYLLRLARGDSAQDLRNSFLSFVSISNTDNTTTANTSKVNDGAKLASRLEYFSLMLGRLCPEKEFLPFYDTLKTIDPQLAQAALYGFKRELVAKEPEKALEVLRTSIEDAQSDVPSPGAAHRSAKFLESIVQYVSRAEDFPQVENVISQFETSLDFKAQSARQDLISRWSYQDPEAAANQILDNPEKYPVELLEYAASGGFKVMLRKHGEEAAMSWLLSMPEGVARNSAIYGAARQDYEGNIEQARRIASLMAPEDRAVIFKNLPYISK